MKRSHIIILVLIVLVILAGAGTYWYAFMRTHRNMQKARPSHTLSSSQLLSDFSNDEKAAFEKYAGKVVEINGEIIAVNKGENQVAVVLEDRMFGITAYLDSSFVAENGDMVNQLNAEQEITLRGQCDGLLSDVVISRAVIVQ